MGPVLLSSKYLLDPRKTRPPLLYSIVAVQTDPLLPSLSFLLLEVVASFQNLPGKGTYVSMLIYAQTPERPCQACSRALLLHSPPRPGWEAFYTSPDVHFGSDGPVSLFHMHSP